MFLSRVSIRYDPTWEVLPIPPVSPAASHSAQFPFNSSMEAGSDANLLDRIVGPQSIDTSGKRMWTGDEIAGWDHFAFSVFFILRLKNPALQESN